MIERNAGFEIIASEVYHVSRLGQQSRIVLGRMETKLGIKYVTWESTLWPVEDHRAIDYYWGHYFDDEEKARADYHRRLFEKYEN